MWNFITWLPPFLAMRTSGNSQARAQRCEYKEISLFRSLSDLPIWLPDPASLHVQDWWAILSNLGHFPHVTLLALSQTTHTLSDIFNNYLFNLLKISSAESLANQKTGNEFQNSMTVSVVGRFTVPHTHSSEAPSLSSAGAQRHQRSTGVVGSLAGLDDTRMPSSARC